MLTCSSNVGFYLGTETTPCGITKQHVTDISRNRRAQHAKNIPKSFLEGTRPYAQRTSSGVNNTVLTNCRGDCLLSLPQHTHTHVHSLLPGATNLKLQLSTFLPHKDNVHWPPLQSGEASWSGIYRGVWTGQSQFEWGRHSAPPSFPSFQLAGMREGSLVPVRLPTMTMNPPHTSWPVPCRSEVTLTPSLRSLVQRMFASVPSEKLRNMKWVFYWLTAS